MTLAAALNDKAAVTGNITKVEYRNGTYLVFAEELGHVREGAGTHGIYVPWEDVEAMNPGA